MKQLFFAAAFLLISTFSIAQTKKTTEVKTKTKTKTTATKPAGKPAAPKGETEEERAARLQKIDTRARAMTATMAGKIGLSLEQQVEVNKINRLSIEQVEAAKVKYIKNLKKMNAEIQNIGTSRLSLLKDVLSPEQFDAYMKKREEKMGIPQINDKPKAPAQQNYDQ